MLGTKETNKGFADKTAILTPFRDSNTLIGTYCVRLTLSSFSDSPPITTGAVGGGACAKGACCVTDRWPPQTGVSQPLT